MIRFDINDKSLATIARVIEKRLKNKDAELTLILDENMAELDSSYHDGVIRGGSYSDILYVAGKYLRDPRMANGDFHSYKEMCGLYWATHNQGYAEIAPMEELYDDLEEQALWGMNTLKVWYDMAQHKIEESADFIARLSNLMRYAKELGMKLVLGGPSNEAFDDSPEELRADWTSGHDGYVKNLNAHYHREICPSKPGGIEKIIENRRAVLDAFGDIKLDFQPLGPYDQGGCTCPDCAPWGGNGYIRCVKALVPLLKEKNPDAKIIMSTWYFGTFREVGDTSEFDMLRDEIAAGNLEDVAYVCSEPGVNMYPYRNPLGKPYIGFPEISMCGIFPWGGYGAISVPKRIQTNWEKGEAQQVGGLPYCEGFYEDINKAFILRLYRDNQNVSETVREYVSYFFGLEGDLLDKVCDAIMSMEDTHARGWEPGHRYPISHPEKIFDIERAILEAHETLPAEIRDGKRWRLFYYRAVIDAALARNDFYRDDTVMQYFKEMIELYHLQYANWYVKPDIMTDEKYGRPLTKDELKIIALGGSID